MTMVCCLSHSALFISSTLYSLAGASTPSTNLLPFQNYSIPEQLTDLGLYQTCFLGSSLRSKYVLGDASSEPGSSAESDGTFLPHSSITDGRTIFSGISTDTDRTILSGTSSFSCMSYFAVFSAFIVKIGFFPHEIAESSLTSRMSRKNSVSLTFTNQTKLSTLPFDMTSIYEDYMLNGYLSWFVQYTHIFNFLTSFVCHIIVFSFFLVLLLMTCIHSG